ncbi:hypothetical protein ATN83_0918 [Raoultella ornithinolytica]|nr:hypothetical protein ATN83_0918 [Raoultella ornithinolytica]AYW56276.1 hypothetical protein EFT36_21010 [Raoultella ornithinolytica]HCJ02812.1 hypothetical protein [Raoultella ornithinolytica]
MLIYQNIVSLFVMVSAIHYKMLRWIAVFLLFQLASRGDLCFHARFLRFTVIFQSWINSLYFIVFISFCLHRFVIGSAFLINRTQKYETSF